MSSSLRDVVILRQLPFKRFPYVLKKDFSSFISPCRDSQVSLWWIHNYWWLHISSELLQSPRVVIVREVICIKLIIQCIKGHKSVHYQFSGKCFKHTLFYIVQGKNKRDFMFSLRLYASAYFYITVPSYLLSICCSKIKYAVDFQHHLGLTDDNLAFFFSQDVA